MSKHFIKIDTTYYPMNGIIFTVMAHEGDIRVTLYGIGVEEYLAQFVGKQAEVLRDWLEEVSIDRTAEEDA